MGILIRDTWEMTTRWKKCTLTVPRSLYFWAGGNFWKLDRLNVSRSMDMFGVNHWWLVNFRQRVPWKTIIQSYNSATHAHWPSIPDFLNFSSAQDLPFLYWKEKGHSLDRFAYTAAVAAFANAGDCERAEATVDRFFAWWIHQIDGSFYAIWNQGIDIQDIYTRIQMTYIYIYQLIIIGNCHVIMMSKISCFWISPKFHHLFGPGRPGFIELLPRDMEPTRRCLACSCLWCYACGCICGMSYTSFLNIFKYWMYTCIGRCWVFATWFCCCPLTRLLCYRFARHTTRCWKA